MQVTVTISDAYTGQETSSSSVTCNLLQTLGLSTSLNIYVQDDSNNHRPIVGLQLYVEYSASTAETSTPEFTDTNGVVKMDLTTPSGGGYTGQIRIRSDETTLYNASNMTLYVNSGQNDATLTLPLKETLTPTSTQNSAGTGTDWQLIIEAIAVVGFLAFLSVIAFTYVKKNKVKESK